MEIPRHWRLKAQRYRLEGSICPICGQLAFPPRLVCSHYDTQPVWTRGCKNSQHCWHRNSDASILVPFERKDDR